MFFRNDAVRESISVDIYQLNGRGTTYLQVSRVHLLDLVMKLDVMIRAAMNRTTV
jgi:hypothetical protein